MSKEEFSLNRSIRYIKGVGPKLAGLLGKKGVNTIEDALYFLPRAYEDRRQFTAVSEVQPGQTLTVFGEVSSAKKMRTRRRPSFEVILNDGEAKIALFWFNCYPGLAQEFQLGNKYVVYGQVRQYAGMLQIVHPDYERVKEIHEGKPVISGQFGRILPIYSETEGLHQKTLRKVMGQVLQRSASELHDPLPESLKKRLSLPSLRSSFAGAHFPEQMPPDKELSPEMKRIIFEEFFILQLGLALKRQNRHTTKAIALSDYWGFAEKFKEQLPFSLTSDQARALTEIRDDLQKKVAMTRLIQGDVGSGKTAIAFAAAAICAGSGCQTALMAPTEVLAQQHLANAARWLEPLGIRCALASQGASRDLTLRQQLKEGKIEFVIGTHALFQEKVEFKKLALVIVDEQHRFGVEQRNDLLKKAVPGQSPHLLMMSATPIPRTLAFTLYGDLDFSVIREKPAGRQPITTKLLYEKQRPKLYETIRKTIERKEQVYIIYPLVEASDKLELKSATEMFERLKSDVFPEFRIALLHGRMKAEEKDHVLSEFSKGKFDILVSTTVIEVGIDVANATLMVIEHPERLGLSQLHQLRGRVGRGKSKSQCILIAKFFTERLKIMEKSDDGFVIAEEDLRIRGPGEFLGTRQSGLPGFRVGHILRDASLLSLARREAQHILDADPGLESPENAGLRTMVESRWKEKLDRLQSG